MYIVPSQEIGDAIPNNTPHAVSVTLPTWEATIGYEEGEDWVVNKMTSGYPRFFIHSKIQELARLIEAKFGREDEQAFIFPSYNVAKRCREFIKEKSTSTSLPSVRILQLTTPAPKTKEEESYRIEAKIAVVFFPKAEFPLAKAYWQHSGEGISSRMGEYVLQELQITHNDLYQDKDKEFKTFIEERFGRNLDLSFAKEAKLALKRRIAGEMDEHSKSSSDRKVSEEDVFLFPSGMASIFTAHQTLLKTLPNEKSVCFGFPYVDTLNILKKFGPGVHFFGFGDDESLEELETQLANGEKILGFFSECPSNPLLRTPNLKKVKELSEKYNFAIITDETVGNFLNIDVLQYSDIVVSSLTKVFSGDSNVMAGSLVLNPQSRYYETLKKFISEQYEDLFWSEDAIYLERNSRDFQLRSDKVNKTSEKVVKLLQESKLLKELYYPSISDTKKYYDLLKNPHGGYGGLISLVFHEPEAARVFFNEVMLSKGPSLGTNFTIACPYTILAHYQELDEVQKWGVDKNLVRLSVGLEDEDDLLETLQKALNLAELSIS